ncbi:NitT/TauT family transport system ATP-binding protein/taurine transport system ATP-binding protein [Sanguibacter gelidistatuariae]|uniref:NitT/TauT family transport system ATP-binding protein/taurine transport system ATP-binding protein n=1 Tax=Sanguibacter gelidistatuariae TaxID=1814289 RepID=A0A1G6H179_9MICO|nr:ABC transporter ATP-binding protein [Sanguibacter gelidistatuariae]SDB87675.1 NitT/TauT family transport system ATP-binding protein/taurine transport system ATP-binding protein [Sanguibacter gelidistatuariae]
MSAPGLAGLTPSAPTASRLVLTGVEQRFRAKDGSTTHALGPLDLDVVDGSFLAVVGPSGCGKSTLLRLVAGFAQPTAGSVEVGGRVVDGPSPDRGVVFQQPNLYPWLSVAENVAFGLKMRHVPRAERRAIVAEHLELVGLADVASRRPYELSGGMQQRVQLARVLANRPSVVLMDEPFAALDAITRERLQDELLRIWRTHRTTVVFITHSVDEAVYLGTRVLVMSPRPGTIVADEPVTFSTSDQAGDAVRDDPAFIEQRRRISAHLRPARNQNPQNPQKESA